MNIFTIVSHLGTLLSLGKSLETMVEEIIAKRSVPDCQSIDSFLDAVEKLFQDGVIDIKGLDDKLIAGAIQQIRDQLKCKVP